MAKFSIKSLFLQEDELTATDSQKTPVTSSPVINSPLTASTMGQEDASIKEMLTKTIETANIEGFDYIEFIRVVEEQAQLIPAEQVRFQSTAATANAMGCTKDKLIQSAQFYLGVLGKKETEFMDSVNKQIATTVTVKEDTLLKIDEDIKGKAELIKQITNEINALQTRKNLMVNEVSENKIKIERVRNNFSATLKIFTDRIKNDIEKIEKYITQK
ncbi:MAG: hypothetical protein Q7R33_02785 [Nitrosarchaeum sp.]|nr:hypothetical protein [Nitrosarchaeum sp.]